MRNPLTFWLLYVSFRVMGSAFSNRCTKALTFCTVMVPKTEISWVIAEKGFFTKGNLVGIVLQFEQNIK